MKQVGDFGLSRLKHETYLTTKTGKGTVTYLASWPLFYQSNESIYFLYNASLQFEFSVDPQSNQFTPFNFSSLNGWHRKFSEMNPPMRSKWTIWTGKRNKFSWLWIFLFNYSPPYVAFAFPLKCRTWWILSCCLKLGLMYTALELYYGSSPLRRSLGIISTQCRYSLSFAKLSGHSF